MTIILNLLSFLNVNGLLTHARVASIHPETGNLVNPSSEQEHNDVLMEPAHPPLNQDPDADPAVGITAEQAGYLPTPTGGVPLYETPIFIGAVIFCFLLAGLIVYLKKRK